MDFDKRFKFPSTMIVMGASGCGKTQWISKLLNNLDTTLTCVPENILLCYGVYQPIYEQLMNNVGNFNIVDGCSEAAIEQYDILNPITSSILILDDLHQELANNPLLSKLFCKFSHHHNTMVILITQNMYHQGKAMRDTISNCHYVIALAQPRDKTAIACLARQMFPRRQRYLLDAYDDATQQPYGYLIIDARPETPAKLRLRSGIFPDESDVAWVPT